MGAVLQADKAKIDIGMFYGNPTFAKATDRTRQACRYNAIDPTKEGGDSKNAPICARNWVVVGIANETQLKAWLNSQSRKVAVAIAARAALRVAPLTYYIGATPGQSPETASVLTSFRAMSVLWFFGYRPNQGTEVTRAATCATSATTHAVYATRAATAAARGAFWDNIATDVNAIEAERPPTILMLRPLWTASAPDKLS